MFGRDLFVDRCLIDRRTSDPGSDTHEETTKSDDEAEGKLRDVGKIEETVIESGNRLWSYLYKFYRLTDDAWALFDHNDLFRSMRGEDSTLASRNPARSPSSKRRHDHIERSVTSLEKYFWKEDV